jgi:hypothetical protein
VSRILLLLCAGLSLFAQDLATEAPSEGSEFLRRNFEAALAGDPENAIRTLPSVIDQPWIGEVSFRDACALARAVAHPEGAPLVKRLILATGLHNPALALREPEAYLALDEGHDLFARFVLAAPGEAMSLATGTSKWARSFRESMSAPVPPEFPLLLRLADETAIDLSRRQRLAVFASRIVRGDLSFDAALRISGDATRFFSAVMDMRAAAGPESEALDRVLESESLMFCRAARESLGRTMSSDLAGFRANDLYAMLSLGRAEATPEVFAPVFDRLLLPKWAAESPKGRSLLILLDRTHNWGLRDFAASALAAHRFERLLAIAGPELITRLASGVEQSADPLKEGMRLAEIVDATTEAGLLARLRLIVLAEWSRCKAAKDSRCTTIYGLLAAKLNVETISDPYRPFFESSATLDSASLFGPANDCIERHFFYDDSDGVQSFQSFRRTYESDPAWEEDDQGTYVHFTGTGPSGRRIEIFANVPIDEGLPQNQAREGEAERRQQAIAEALQKRRLVATVIVHRGHAFWTDRTIGYIAPTARLVILGSCGGLYEVHRVIEAAHESQVIATRGIGATEINDTLLKAVNDRILTGDRVIQWAEFWQRLSAVAGKSGLFRDYVAPHQDAGIVFLRAYYRFLDAR